MIVTSMINPTPLDERNPRKISFAINEVTHMEFGPSFHSLSSRENFICLSICLSVLSLQSNAFPRPALLNYEEKEVIEIVSYHPLLT